MADVYQYINPTGTIVPQTSDILATEQAEFQTIFGSDLVVTADTPQGVLITALALVQTSVVNNNAALANQINPNIAGGVFLDAIMALTGVQRTPATQTVVNNVTLTGVVGTVVPAGSQAQTSDNDIFVTLSTVTIDMSGVASVNFASQAYGAIACPENALNTIVSNVLGWETVNNTTAGILGTSTQSDQAARALRTNTLAFQGVSLPVAITSALYNVAGVTSLSFLENYNSIPMGMVISVTGGTTLANTIWALTTTGNIVVDTDDMAFSENGQALPNVSPWPLAAFSTTGNITLSGLSTQGGGDWAAPLTAGNIILVKNQSVPSQNGLWVAASGSWARQAYNTSGTTLLGSNSGISLIANSIWACVNGGSDLNVAAALLENKSSGCGWNGGTFIDLIEPVSNQTYIVEFDRPAQVSVVIKVTTSNGSTANITQAILDYANGLINGFAGFVVGADVSPFEISGAILSIYPNYFISKVEVSLQSSISYSTATLAIALNQIAYTQQSYITVVIA